MKKVAKAKPPWIKITSENKESCLEEKLPNEHVLEYLEQNPIGSFIDLDDPEYEHLKDPEQIETYVMSHGSLLVEFDKRIWELHCNPHFKEWRD